MDLFSSPEYQFDKQQEFLISIKQTYDNQKQLIQDQAKQYIELEKQNSHYLYQIDELNKQLIEQKKSTSQMQAELIKQTEQILKMTQLIEEQNNEYNELEKKSKDQQIELDQYNQMFEQQQQELKKSQSELINKTSELKKKQMYLSAENQNIINDRDKRLQDSKNLIQSIKVEYQVFKTQIEENLTQIKQQHLHDSIEMQKIYINLLNTQKQEHYQQMVDLCIKIDELKLQNQSKGNSDKERDNKYSFEIQNLQSQLVQYEDQIKALNKIIQDNQNIIQNTLQENLKLVNEVNQHRQVNQDRIINRLKLSKFSIYLNQSIENLTDKQKPQKDLTQEQELHKNILNDSQKKLDTLTKENISQKSQIYSLQQELLEKNDLVDTISSSISLMESKLVNLQQEKKQILNQYQNVKYFYSCQLKVLQQQMLGQEKQNELVNL